MDKPEAYNVIWADGRAVAAYPTAAMARKAAAKLDDVISIKKGPAQGRIRTQLPKKGKK